MQSGVTNDNAACDAASTDDCFQSHNSIQKGCRYSLPRRIIYIHDLNPATAKSVDTWALAVEGVGRLTASKDATLQAIG